MSAEKLTFDEANVVVIVAGVLYHGRLVTDAAGIIAELVMRFPQFTLSVDQVQQALDFLIAHGLVLQMPRGYVANTGTRDIDSDPV